MSLAEVSRSHDHPKHSLDLGAEIRLHFPAHADSVPQARHAVDRLVSHLECDHGAIRIAVSELVGNAAMHAYPNEGGGTVLVLTDLRNDRFLLAVADRGRGLKRPSPRSGLGMGLVISERLSDDFRIASDSRGTAVATAFELGAARRRPQPAQEREADLELQLTRAREWVEWASDPGPRRLARIGELDRRPLR